MLTVVIKGLLVDVDIPDCHGLLGVVGDNLVESQTGELLVVNFVECPSQALGKVIGVLVLSDVSVFHVVYHLRDASHVEAYAGESTGHGFHDGVGKVVFQGWEDEDISGIIDIDDLPFVANVP